MMTLMFYFSCWKDVGKYTCPRCQLPYCSVKCYQDSEHQNCSEKFYEEEVVAELKDSNATLVLVYLDTLFSGSVHG